MQHAAILTYIPMHESVMCVLRIQKFIPVLLSYVSAMWKPIGRTKIDSFSTVEPRVEARMIRIWEGDHKGTLLVYQPVHRDPTSLQSSQQSGGCTSKQHALLCMKFTGHLAPS